MIGSEIDVVCSGASSLRGQVVKAEDGVLQLKDENGQVCYVAIDKIVVVWAKRDKEHPAGFVSKN